MPATLDLRRGQVVGDASRRAINLNTLTKAAAGTTYAPIASPTFTGDPKAPTPAPGDNDTSVATTAFVHAAVAAGGGITQLTGDATAGPGSGPQALTLAAVNGNIGTFQGITVNAKGLVTAAAAQGYLTVSGVSGMTAGQIPIAASATTVTSSIPQSTFMTPAQVAATYAPIASPSFTGNVSVAGSLNTNTAVTTGDANIEIGQGRGGAGNAYLDLHAQTGTLYELRLIRASGANGNAQLINNGTGTLSLVNQGGARVNNGTGDILTVDGSGNTVVNGTMTATAHSGTATNNNAPAGFIGEVISAVNGSQALVAGTATNLCTIALTAGDWDVNGEIWAIGSNTTVEGGINTVSATVPGGPSISTSNISLFITGMTNAILAVCPVRLSLAATTNVYLIVKTTAAITGAGKILARRAR
jgi:hypothetical protein